MLQGWIEDAILADTCKFCVNEKISLNNDLY